MNQKSRQFHKYQILLHIVNSFRNIAQDSLISNWAQILHLTCRRCQEKSVEKISAMQTSEGRLTKRGTRSIGIELSFLRLSYNVRVYRAERKLSEATPPDTQLISQLLQSKI